MYKLWITIKKDAKILLRDRTGISLMFVMPIILVMVVTSIQTSTFQLMNKSKLPVLVCNKDTGQASLQLMAAINRVGLLKVLPLPKDQALDQIDKVMKDKDAELAIAIPSNFSARVSAKAQNAANKALKSFGLQGDSTKNNVLSNKPPFTLYFSPVLQEQLRLSIRGGLRSALQLVESRETLRKLYFAINEKQLPPALEDEMINNQSDIGMVSVSKNAGREVPNTTQHNVPAWTIFAMFFIIMSLAASVVREKISGSFIRLKTLPTNYLVGLLSKQITYLCVTLFQAVVIFSMGIYLFPHIGLPGLNLPSDLTALIITTVVTGWCAVSYAICVGVFSNTQIQASGFGAVSIVILAVVGGLMVPTFAMDGYMKTVSNISPLHWSLECYYDLFLLGGKLRDVFANLIPLFIITLVLQALTFIGLKRQNLI
ncbi:MAG TPA: ABC transporter permease [Mucilaginibacter sp.]|jgi:ABC-2 type transport system permease protein|nr:ABC transporter permease [Mucilaginibacter sp.]